jgi:hypothetical protein
MERDLMIWERKILRKCMIQHMKMFTGVKQEGQYAYNVTVTRVRVTIFAVEKQ